MDRVRLKIQHEGRASGWRARFSAVIAAAHSREPGKDGRQQRDCDLHYSLKLAWLDWRRFAQGQKTTQEEGLSTCKTEV